MASIDTLIANAESRASTYANTTDFLVAELRQFITDHPTSPIDTGTLDLSQFAIADYVSPAQDLVAMPVYEPPIASLPTTPVLTDIGALTMPAERVEPTLNTSGLFAQIAPSSNLPDFNEAEPDLNIDGLVAELSALVTPSISDFVFPEISSFSLAAAPSLTLPAYDAPATPDLVRDPVDYAVSLDDTYHQMSPEMQAWVDDKTAVWVATYAPEYTPWVTGLQAKVIDGLAGTVLPDQFENAMFTRAQGRIEREFTASENTILTTFSKSGFMEPPGAVVSAVLNARWIGANALADQSTDIYIERRKTEVQHLQFIMNLASAQIASVRTTAVAYAQAVGQNMQTALAYATSIADKLEKVFEHLIARAQLQVSILTVINAQYEVKLKAALSALEGYKLSLEAERLKTEIEVAKIGAIESQIKAEGLNIQRYSAIIDSVTKKGYLEELKLKGYSIRADIFKAETTAKVAGFEMYNAALRGDQSKLEGELSKIRVFEQQINIDKLRLEAQVQQIGAVKASNEVKTEIFSTGAEVYKLGIDTAVQKFTAEADVKKLAQAIYGQELVNAIEKYKVGLELPKLMMEAVLKQYELQIQAAIETARIEVEKLKISENASVQSVGAYQAMASSALGSLNTMASSAIQSVA